MKVVDEKYGWCEEIQRDFIEMYQNPYAVQKNSDEYIALTLNDLKADDHVEIRRMRLGTVGAKFLLQEIILSDKFNESFREKIKILSQDYHGYRKIRGDGNCYYRAVMFGILEQAISNVNIEIRTKILRHIYHQFSSLEFDDHFSIKKHNYLLNVLKQAIGK